MATNNKDFVVKNGIQVGENATITGALTAAGLQYPVSDGTTRQAIVTNGLGVLNFENLDDVRTTVTNQTGSLIPKGAPVYQTGSSGQTLTIALADASDPAKMPAIGIAADDIANGDTGSVIHFGRIQGVDTSAFNEGDRVYVGVGGGYTNVRPSGENNQVQFLGVVTKVHAVSGSGVMFGAGNVLDVPNLDAGHIFIGDANGNPDHVLLNTDLVPEGSAQYFTTARAITAIEQAQHITIDGGTLYIDTDNNYVGIGDTSPQNKLDVAGTIGVNGTTVIDAGSEIVTAQLKNSGVTAGSYGSASQVPVITVDVKGRVTSATTTAVAGVSSFLYDSPNERLIIGTADGQSFNAGIALGGSLTGPLDNIKVKYQPAAPVSPSQGTFYFDSLNQKLMVYTGSSWVDAVPAGASSGGGTTTDAVATMEKFQYVTSSTTNAVSGVDANGNTLAYIVDGSQNVEVYVNGIKQFEGASNDYVATTGTSVTFTYNLPAGSVVDVQVYELLTQDAFYLKSETYTKTETNSQISTAVSSYLPLTGGTLTGNLAVPSLTSPSYISVGSLVVNDPGSNYYIWNNRIGDKTVIAKGGINGGTISFEDESSNAHLVLAGTDSRVRLQFGTYNDTPYSGWIQASYDNSVGGSGSSGTEPLALNPQGGQVTIGTNTRFATTTVPLYVKGGTSGWSVFERSNKRLYVNANYSDTNTAGQLTMQATDNMALSLSARENLSDLYLTTSGLVGVGTSSPLAKLHVSYPAMTAAPPSLGWPVYNAEQDANARTVIFDGGGNGSVTTAGQGPTVGIVLGSYYDSRVVITPLGAGGGSPSDQGTGRGKDLFVKGGTSDNGVGLVGGRLYLSGGMGFTSGGFNGNVGDLHLQPFGGLVKTNGVAEYYIPIDSMMNNQTYDFDVVVGDEGGQGNLIEVHAMYDHYYNFAYGAGLITVVGKRQTSVQRSDIWNYTSGNGGSWSVSAPNSSTLRITKNAGSYPGSGYGHILVRWRKWF